MLVRAIRPVLAASTAPKAQNKAKLSRKNSGLGKVGRTACPFSVAKLERSSRSAKALVVRLFRDFPREHEPCPIGSDRALDNALITAPEARDPELLKRLDAVAGRILRLAIRSAGSSSATPVPGTRCSKR
jgi:hypothetical protein